MNRDCEAFSGRRTGGTSVQRSTDAGIKTKPHAQWSSSDVTVKGLILSMHEWHSQSRGV